jgi:hypothetical protein
MPLHPGFSDHIQKGIDFAVIIPIPKNVSHLYRRNCARTSEKLVNNPISFMMLKGLGQWGPARYKTGAFITESLFVI